MVDIFKENEWPFNMGKTNFVSVLLVVFYVLDAFGKLSQYNNDSQFLLKAIKGVLMAFFVYKIVAVYKDNFFTYWCIVLGVIFLISQFTIDGNILLNGVYFLKYLFPIVLLYYYNLNELNEKKRDSLFKTFESLLLFNSVLVFLGLLLSIDLFKTYLGGARFGYNGLFLAGSTSTYVYIFYIGYIIVFKNRYTLNWKNFVVLGAIVLVGTKSVYLVMSLTGFYLLFFSNIKYKIAFIISFCMIISIVFYLVFFEYGLFNAIRIEQDFLTALLSFRDQLLFQKLIPFIKENWSFINYLFGGVSSFSITPQMGFIDMFSFFGIIGMFIYLTMFIKSFITFKKVGFINFFLIILFIVIFLSGNFFYNATLPIYMLVIREQLNSLQRID